MEERCGLPLNARQAVVPMWVLLTCLLRLATPAGAQSCALVEVGYRDFDYGTVVTSSPTGEKPESKPWWNDGFWWAYMWNPVENSYHVYRLNAASQCWTDTGTAIDDRASSKADVLWDDAGRKLYVVSHVFTTNGQSTTSNSQWARLYRFSYNPATRTYSPDSGFPATVNRGKAEAITIAKDSQSRLWVTYVQDERVMVNHSLSSDAQWAEPFILPVSSQAMHVSADDISAVIAFQGDKIGVLWSNQLNERTYFAVHRDEDPPQTWQPEEVILPDSNCFNACADDHMSLKTDASGRVFAALKTSLTDDDAPLVLLAVRAAGGPFWSSYTFGRVQDSHTRPIVLLDEQNSRVYIFASQPERGGAIYGKSSPLDNINFPVGIGEPLIKSSADARINDPTSTKQNLSSTTDLMVLASDKDTNRYLHGYLDLMAPGQPAIASFDPMSGPVGTEVVIMGDDFTGTTQVAFNGSPASFTVVSDDSINTTVPVGTTTGKIRVTNAVGSGLSASDFTVTQPSPGGARIKDITFESGSLTDPTTGVDRTSGTVTLQASSPLAGVYSARIPSASSSYVEENVDPTNDFYVSFYFRVAALPASDVRVAQIMNSGVTVGNVVLRSDSGLRLRAGSTTVGTDSAPIVAGQIYRLGIHQKRGTGGNAILEAYVASGSDPFGAPFAATTAGTWTSAADRLRLGATAGSVSLDMTMDDILLDAGAMPSANNSPSSPVITTFSPTNGSAGTAVTLTGSNFTGTASVTFNGTTASFTVVSGTRIDTTVPTGATTGRIGVTSPAGSALSSTDFTVIQPSPGGARIKDITFEGGSLTDTASGADRTVGTVTLVTSSTLAGAYSARIPNAGSSYLEENFDSANDFFVSFYFRVAALPASDVRIVQISNAGVTVGNVLLRSGGSLSLRVGSTTIGADSGSILPGQIYRLGIHQMEGAGTNGRLEAFVAAGAEPFGTPFSSTAAGTWTGGADRLRLGTTTGNGVDVVMDDIRLDVASMPGP